MVLIYWADKYIKNLKKKKDFEGQRKPHYISVTSPEIRYFGILIILS